MCQNLQNYEDNYFKNFLILLSTIKIVSLSQTYTKYKLISIWSYIHFKMHGRPYNVIVLSIKGCFTAFDDLHANALLFRVLCNVLHTIIAIEKVQF